MPKTNWSELSPLQLGRYAEYYAKMEFTSYGFDKCFISDRYWSGEEPAKATGIKGIQKIFYSAKGHV